MAAKDTKKPKFCMNSDFREPGHACVCLGSGSPGQAEGGAQAP